MGIKGGGYTSDDQYAKNAKAEHDALAYFIATSNCDAIDGGLVIFSAGNDALRPCRVPRGVPRLYFGNLVLARLPACKLHQLRPRL